MDRLPRWKRFLPRLRHRRTHTSALHSQMNAESPRQVLWINRIWQPNRQILNSMADTLMTQPRCLQNVDCTQLLTGGSTHYENFSASCWLEDHLHRFGLPSSSSQVTASSCGSSVSNDSGEPPPYVDEPPPSYEEAVAQTQHMDTDDGDDGVLWF